MNSRRRGFALVVVLSLMVILVLLLLSLSQVLQTEIHSSTAGVNVSQARSVALFGLNKAVGELQAIAGPDQRVTATADILKGGYSGKIADPTKAHWTGVWNAATYNPQTPQTKDFLGWLVSSPSRLTSLTDAESTLAGETIQLVGEGTVGSDTNRQVSAPLVPLQDDAGKTLGKFAFWVGDEGVKAKFDLPRPSDSAPSARRARYDFMASQRNAVESFGTGAAGSVFTEAVALNTNAPKLLTRDHVQLLGGNAMAIRENFHDFALFSKGVLSDTAKGGLKRDLTWLFEASSPAAELAAIDKNPSSPGSQIVAAWPADSSQVHWPASPTWELLRSFYRMKDEPTPLATRKQTATDQGVMPLVTRCLVNFRPGVRSAGSNSYLRLNLDVQIALWNPYNIALAGRAYDLEIALSSFKFFLEVGGVDRGTSYDMQGVAGAGFKIYNNTFSNTISGRCISFRIPAVNLSPGESQIFTIATGEHLRPYSGANLLANQTAILGSPNSVWMEHPTPVPQAPPIANFRLRRQATPTSANPGGGEIIHIALKDPGTGGNTNADDYWSRVGRRSGESSQAFVDPDPTTLFNALVSSNNHMLQQFHARRFTGDGYRNERWMANYNPRATIIDRSQADINNNPLYVFESRNRKGFWPMPDFSPSNPQAPFELPTSSEKRLSIADFQHTNVHPQGTSNAYLIGNSLLDMRLGGADTDAITTTRLPPAAFAPVVDGSFLLNTALWDGFFLSTVDPGLTDADLEAGILFPNARMKPEGSPAASDLKSFDNASAHLMLDGAFNINSTSVDAWKAILAGKRGLPFNPVTGGSATPSGITFSRLARPVGGENEPWLGYRELTDAQLQLLAEKIVAEVRARGPFLSLADFVNRRLLSASDPTAVKGALARSIDQANINSNAAQGLPNYTNDGSNWSQPEVQSWYLEQALVGSRNEAATNWITQGDILQAIGGMIAPRSDTFVVRAYGSSLNPKGAISAEAWCEAIVQRSIEPVEASETNEFEPRDPNLLGRRFRIVSFRWLDRDQL